MLFDAAELSEDDDFGDSEDAAGAKAADLQARGGTAQTTDRLLDLDSGPETAPPTSCVASFAQNPVSGFSSSRNPVSEPPQAAKTDAWETFDEWETSLPDVAPAPTPGKRRDKTLVASSAVEERDEQTRPTNVPPPRVLLAAFPPLFEEAQQRVLKSFAAHTPARDGLVSDPGTSSFLEGYLATATVAARIVAGRKLRWKRDKRLAEGMRIGPASSRGSSGMKLAGIEKSEAVKEDREVADTVRVWRQQLGRLRQAVAAVHSAQGAGVGQAPELLEAMAVRALAQLEGGVPSRTACALCGLKRDERVAGVDVAADDSFGEYWVDAMGMHRGRPRAVLARAPCSLARRRRRLTPVRAACQSFWVEHEAALRQR